MADRVIKTTGRSMRLDEWAMELGCSVETLRRAIRNRELLATVEPLSHGPNYRVTAVDMAAFLEKRRTRLPK